MKKADPKFLKHKRRLCQVEGCPRIVKSQGRCQRHGAKPKSCKVNDCSKQAQGNFDGMCKAHFHEVQRAERPLLKSEDVLEASLHHSTRSVYDTILPASIGWSADANTPMPLIEYLKDNFDRGTAWHRNDERMARGIPVVTSPAMQLEGWERELVWTETLLLTGTAEASFRHLARAWGRDKGFHRVLAQSICERHGSVERNKATVSPLDTEFCAATIVDNYMEDSNNEAEVEVWDGACYYELDYNERLASELMLDLVEEDQNCASIDSLTTTVESS